MAVVAQRVVGLAGWLACGGGLELQRAQMDVWKTCLVLFNKPELRSWTEECLFFLLRVKGWRLCSC